MKKIAYLLIALTTMVFTFTSCSDVPMPYEQPSIYDDGSTSKPEGDGSAANPFNIAAAVAKCKEVGNTLSEEKYYIKGYVTKATTADATYGNATFTMSDDTEGNGGSFTAYQIAGNNGDKLTAGYAFNVGDIVTIYGKIYNYSGSTPETEGKGAAWLIAHEKSGSGGGGGLDVIKKVTVAEFNAAEVENDTWYEMTGTVKNLKDGDQYGNFDLEDATGSVYVYGLLSEKGGEKKLFQELVAKYGIANGSTITIRANRGVYNDKIEAVNAYYVPDGGDNTPAGGAKGDGSLQSPYNPLGAINAVKDLTWTSNTDYQKTDNVYVKGKISRIANNGTYSASGTYGNASFYISEDGTEADEFYCYHVLYLGNQKYASGTDIKVGDEVIICGKLMNYRGNTPETVNNEAYLYSLNGTTDGGGSGGDTSAGSGDGSVKSPYNVAAITEICAKLADKEVSTTDYYIKGKICSVKYTFSAQYGTATFNISDDGNTGGTEFTAYGVYYLGNQPWADGNTQIAVGDNVILHGIITNYGGTLETSNKNAYIYSLNGKTSDSGSESGGGESGGSGTVSGNTITVTMSGLGLANAAEMGTVTLSDGTKLIFDGGGNTNTPKYYNTGTAARMYPKNTVTVTSNSKNISKIEITCADNNAEGNITASKGSVNVSGMNVTVSGINSTSTTITNSHTGTGAVSQLRIASIVITYAQ